MPVIKRNMMQKRKEERELGDKFRKRQKLELQTGEKARKITVVLNSESSIEGEGESSKKDNGLK